MNTNTNATGVKCWKCDKVIQTGEGCIVDNTVLGVWCSIKCWALDKGNFEGLILTEDDLQEMHEVNEKYERDFYEFQYT